VKLRIRGITKHMRERVKQYGNIWVKVRERDGETLLVIPGDSPRRWRYGAWLVPGQEFEILENLGPSEESEITEDTK
jgi:hypothetical protein